MRLRVGEQVPVSDPSRDLYEIDIYFTMQEEALTQFGVDTLLLYQMGTFYEVYGREENEEDERRVAAFAECCNLQDGAHKSTGIPKHRYPSPPRMLGFTDKALDKFRSLLLNAGWTLVIVSECDSQYTTRGKTRTLREITEIVSGATHEDNQVSSYTICAVYIESIPSSSTVQYYSAGFVSLSSSTGKVQLEELTETKSHIQDYIYRFLLSNDPSLVLTCSEEVSQLLDMSGYRTQRIELQPNSKKVKWIYDNLLSCVAKMEVKSYHYKGRQAIAQRLGLPSHIRSAEVLIAFGAIVSYIMKQKPEVIEKLHCNTESQTCMLYGNAIEQLAVLPKKSYVSRVQHIPSARSLQNKKWDSLYSLLDMCATRFGSRLLQYRISHPMIHAESICESHEAVGRLLENQHYTYLRGRMTSSQDGERIIRRVETNWKVSPGLVGSLYTFLKTWRGVQEYIEGNQDLELMSCSVSRWDALLEHLETHFVIDALYENRSGRWDIPIRPQSDLSKEIDMRTHTWQRRMEYIKNILGVKSEKSVKLCSNDTDGYTITIPKSKAKVFEVWKKETISNQDELLQELRGATVKTMASSVRFFHPVWRNDWTSRVKLCDRIHEENKLYLQDWVETFQQDWLEDVDTIVKWAAQLDVWCAFAWCSARYGYHRPTLVEADSNSPVILRGKNLRHPMIERLQEDVAGYVANDVSLDKHQYGMLLYGMNASGKSSYMKSVGLAWIMSQAGCWVPCENCSHSIVSKLFTRISGNDDYMRGKSSFALEMEELSTILYEADAKSVVLGDELCRGTEQISGTALVGAGVETLMKKGVSFVFATHLHNLPKLSNLTPLIQSNQLGIYHLKVLYDSQMQTLEYERKLQRGQGSTLYGIEVAGALGLHTGTLETAMRLREELMGFQEKRSHYNHHKIIKVCEVCGKNPATETHHVLEQHTATQDGIVEGSKRVHARSNLVGICESCHLKHHHSTLKIQGWRETSSGEMKLVIQEQ